MQAPRPVCSRCEIEFLPQKNGVVVVGYQEAAPAYLWSADEWRCPGCEAQVIVGFALRPYRVEGDPDFAQQLDLALGLDRHRRNYVTPRQRAAARPPG